MIRREFNLISLYEAGINYWWLLLVFIIIGGLLGIAYAGQQEALYEASTTILMSVDHNRAAIRDDITIYQADDRVRALILSDRTLKRAMEILSEAEVADLYETPADFRSSTRITQGPASFELYVYSSDPGLAVQSANAWARASLLELEGAMLHALRAAELQGALYEAQCTLMLVGEEGGDQARWVCTSGGSDVDVDDLPDEFIAEIQASRGILPFYSFALGQEAQMPEGPVLWSRAELLLAGVVIGAVLGIVAIFLIASRDNGALEGIGG